MGGKSISRKDILPDLKKIVGDRVSATPAELYCYSMDASMVTGMPDYVVRPMNAEEVSRIVMLAEAARMPITARGAGTGLCGGAVPQNGGIVVDMSGMNRILELDLDNLQVIVEPGIVHERLNSALWPHGFFFPPNPGSSAMCTIGGLISNGGSGMRSVKYGTVRNYVLDLEVVMAGGRIVKTGSKLLKSAAGYDLTRLFVGAEGTIGIITRAGLRIAPLPQARRLVMACFESAQVAGSAVIRVFAAGIVPSACEILDRTTLQVLHACDPNLVLPTNGDVILFEVDGHPLSVQEEAKSIAAVVRPLALSLREATTNREMQEIWAARSLVGAAVSRIDPNMSRIYAGEDVGVPIKQIPAMIQAVESITKELGLPAMKYGHIGDGNLHVAMFIDVMDKDQWAKLQTAADRIHRAAIGLGGTVSSEHGIGKAKGCYMSEQCKEGLDVMRSIKRALDPEGIFNPGKLGL